MKTAIAYLFFAILAFLLAAAGSWYYLNYQSEMLKQEQEETEATEEPVAQEPEDYSSELPIPVTGRPLSAEEIFRFSETIRTRQEALAQREAALEQKELRLKLVHDDIEAEQRELDGMLAQLRDAMDAADQVLAQIQQERSALDAQKAELKQETQGDAAAQANQADTAANLKKFAPLLAGMTPDKAAEMLTQLMNDGDLKTAAQLLRTVEERNASKILEAMDKAIVSDLFEAWKNAPAAGKPTRR